MNHRSSQPQVPYFFLFIAFFSVILHLSYAQPARQNGQTQGILRPVSPGDSRFLRRENRNCPGLFRTLDGSCTNSRDQVAGSASTAHFSYFRRLSTKVPTGMDRPSARHVSNTVCTQRGDIFNKMGLSEFVVFFAQFLDHTFVATTTNKSETMHIDVPDDDPTYANTSVKYLHFQRSVRAEFSRRTGRLTGMVRPINVLSSAIDLSSVYSSEKMRAEALRASTDGLLLTDDDKWLPRNRGKFFNSPTNSDEFFFAGDHRANEHPVLTSFHTLFLREHNLLARELKEVFPSWDDNTLYLNARHINHAQFQKIVYEEFLPVMLGQPLRTYRGHRRKSHPGLSVLFSTAAFRIGHTMVGNKITLKGPYGTPMDPIEMKDIFFRMGEVLDVGVEPFFRGAMMTQAQEIDPFVVPALRDFLFKEVPQELGLDLIALNIQRGRDHALPTFKKLRRWAGLFRTRRFTDISSDPEVVNRLMSAYKSVNDIDPFIGMLAEDHAPGAAMGWTMLRIWQAEFERLRDADRFFYKRPGNFEKNLLDNFPRLKQMLKEKDTMRKILLRNTELEDEELPPSVWRV